MKRAIGIALLGVGIVIAAAYGSLNGERHVSFRQAKAKQAMTASVMGTVKAGQELNAKLASEGVDFGAMSPKEGIDFVKKTPELEKQIKATEDAYARMKAWGENGKAELVAIAADGEVTKIGLPGPQQRFMEWFSAGGIGWIVGLVFIVVGAVLARMQDAEEASGSSPSAGGRVDFTKTIGEVQQRIAAIASDIADLPMDADATTAREALDALDVELLSPLVEGRNQLVAKHGLAGFAEYFGPFSAGERNLNRAWSALTDGHAVVAREALNTATAAFSASLDGYRAVDARG